MIFSLISPKDDSSLVAMASKLDIAKVFEVLQSKHKQTHPTPVDFEEFVSCDLCIIVRLSVLPGSSRMNASFAVAGSFQ